MTVSIVDSLIHRKRENKVLEEEKIDCLDFGFVRLVDIMGNDSSIVQAARTSYGKGTKSTREDSGLIRYLMRNCHSTPFEMVEYKFHIKCPIFVARQWLRHRTASVNEYSLRYSEAKDEFYVPDQDHIGRQDEKNKQGTNFSGYWNLGGMKGIVQEDIHRSSSLSYKEYQKFLQWGVSRETARIVLPVSNYTEFYWKMDLHNLLHFLELRMDSHAQYEIRVFADAIAEFVKKNNPLAWEAFDEYVLSAVTFSKSELKTLKELLQTEYIEEELKSCNFDYFGDSPSEKTTQGRALELLAKLS